LKFSHQKTGTENRSPSWKNFLNEKAGIDTLGAKKGWGKKSWNSRIEVHNTHLIGLLAQGQSPEDKRERKKENGQIVRLTTAQFAIGARSDDPRGKTRLEKKDQGTEKIWYR